MAMSLLAYCVFSMRSKYSSAPWLSTTATATLQLFYWHSARVPAATFLAVARLIVGPYSGRPCADAAPTVAASATPSAIFAAFIFLSPLVVLGWESDYTLTLQAVDFLG